MVYSQRGTKIGATVRRAGALFEVWHKNDGAFGNRDSRADRLFEKDRFANGWGDERRTVREFAARSKDRASLLTLHLCPFGQTTPATAELTAALRLRRLARSLASACRLLVWERQRGRDRSAFLASPGSLAVRSRVSNSVGIGSPATRWLRRMHGLTLCSGGCLFGCFFPDLKLGCFLSRSPRAFRARCARPGLVVGHP